MKNVVGRNDPCPCGSGRKYKNCCAGKQRFVTRQVAGLPVWVILAIGVAAIGVVWFVSRALNPSVPASRPVAAPGVANELVPAPWTYDSVANRYFDPTHGHWHDGRPPASVPPGSTLPGDSPFSGPASTPGTTPAPWTYDAEKNQHWDPNHGHWHPGRPPQGAR